VVAAGGERAGESVAGVLGAVAAVDQHEGEPGQVDGLGAVVAQLDEAVAVGTHRVVVDLVDHDLGVAAGGRRRRCPAFAREHDRAVHLCLDGDRSSGLLRGRAGDAVQALDRGDRTGGTGGAGRAGGAGWTGLSLRSGRPGCTVGAGRTGRACSACRACHVPLQGLLRSLAGLPGRRDEQEAGLVPACLDHRVGERRVETGCGRSDRDGERCEADQGGAQRRPSNPCPSKPCLHRSSS
jgi:hypothetical protein